MALEDALRENTDATNRLTQVTENLIRLREIAIDEVKKAGKTGAAKPAARKPAKKPDPEGGGNITTNPEDRKPPAPDVPDAPTYDDLADAMKAFMGVDEDAGNRKTRVASIRSIFGAPDVDAKKHTDVPKAMLEGVIASIAELHDAAKESAQDDTLLG